VVYNHHTVLNTFLILGRYLDPVLSLIYISVHPYCWCPSRDTNSVAYSHIYMCVCVCIVMTMGSDSLILETQRRRPFVSNHGEQSVTPPTLVGLHTSGHVPPSIDVCALTDVHAAKTQHDGRQLFNSRISLKAGGRSGPVWRCLSVRGDINDGQLIRLILHHASFDSVTMMGQGSSKLEATEICNAV